MALGMVREPGRKGTDKVDTGTLRILSAYIVALKSCGGGVGLLRSSLIVRFGIVKPAPVTSPVAGSPTVGALENWPPRDPSGTGPLEGCRLATAISAFALPALFVDPGGPLGGGAAPFEKDGAPMPGGKELRMFGLPTIDASGRATSAG